MAFNINSKEFGAYLREARIARSVSVDSILENTRYELSDINDLENGKKCSLKIMVKYLKCLDTYFWFKYENEIGKISFKGYFTVFNNTKLSVPTLTTFDFLRVINKSNIRISFNRDDFPVDYVFHSYPDAKTIETRDLVSKCLLRSLKEQRIDNKELAKSLHVSDDGFKQFVYNVVDYDFKFIEAICRTCALKLIVKTNNDKRFSLRTKEDGLYKEVKVSGNKIKLFLVKPGKKTCVSDVIKALPELEYKSLHFSVIKGTEVKCRRKTTTKKSTPAKERAPYIKIVSVPMGGMNKKY